MADLGGRADFKGSTSEVMKLRNYRQDKGEGKENTLVSEKVETVGRRAGSKKGGKVERWLAT